MQAMRGTADVLMAASQFANLSSLFYAVALARDCTGVSCKEGKIHPFLIRYAETLEP